MSSAYETVDLSVDGRIGRVTVDRPESMNAVNKQVLEELADAVESAAAETRVVTLTGAGDRAFIGGGDIKEFQDRSAVWFRSKFRAAMEDVEAAIEDSRVPVIAAVNGAALGGGTEIAIMCDMIIAAESGIFGFPEISLGIIPGSGGTQRVTELVGYLKAKELVLTGRQVPAEEAADIGLANEVVADDRLDERVAELAEDLAEGAPVAQWFAKKSINETRAELETGIELEAALAGILFETADKEEGLSAFVEGRDPEFGSE